MRLATPAHAALPVVLLAALALPVAAQQVPTPIAQPELPPSAQAGVVPAAQSADGIRTEATIVVTGRQPGPGLWRVSKGDHELYILGTLSPLPANMQWQTAEVTDVIARSQEVIRSPYITVGSDASKFRMLFLFPSLIGVKNNPDGKTLKDVLPADVYVRWQAFQKQFLPGKNLEKLRPVFAAQELYKAAIERSGLSTKDVVHEVLKTAIEQHHPDVTVPKIKVNLEPAQMKSAIKLFKSSQVEDVQCMARTLDVIGKDLETMRLRANAWATGDLPALQALPIGDQYQACMDAIGESAVGRKLGLGDMDAKLKALWLEKAEAALAKNTTTFAVMGIRSLMAPGGYLDALRAKGYEVEAPY